MAAHSARKSSGPVIRSISPSPRFNHHNATQSPPCHSSPFASASTSASTSAFTSSRSFRKTTSPTRVNLYNYSNPSISFSMDRSGSPSRTISFSGRSEKPPARPVPHRRTCMCSPTNHPGSFRCSLHKGASTAVGGNSRVSNSSQTASCGSSSRLILRRSAMKNSLVRIGTVEGDLVRRALAALIRPSSHHQRRRGEFRWCPSRLSAMSKA